VSIDNHRLSIDIHRLSVDINSVSIDINRGSGNGAGGMTNIDRKTS